MLGFSERGKGPALVFLHAYPLDHTMWQGQIDFFSSRYRVIAPDTFGFGDSQPPRGWTMPEMGEELITLLNSLGVQRCALVGLSMGGYVGLPFALTHPERVGRLVLAHTRARADTEAERNARNDMIAALEKDGIGMLPAKILPRLLSPAAPESLRQSLTEVIMKATAEAAVYAVTAMRDRFDQTANLARVQCPTLVIAGPDDAIIKVEDCESMAKALPAGELAVVPGSGHLSNLENPPVFNQVLDEFLKRSDPK